ncbi:hypothetical protein A3Q56_05904 [Intoshia linei]|uniref:H/ACA ribonucleoprotein complex non-core subunit NAF1 n=1 Tax=Intoshia linei TaxID=1819745 RepID=A0A177AWI4_9BILA|nr:hypothetical protein A3Q56_05904 [Intoshia linei]
MCDKIKNICSKYNFNIVDYNSTDSSDLSDYDILDYDINRNHLKNVDEKSQVIIQDVENEKIDRSLESKIIDEMIGGTTLNTIKDEGVDPKYAVDNILHDICALVPDLEKLKITVEPDTILVKLGIIESIFEKCVVIDSFDTLGALDVFSIVFNASRDPIGRIVETFGPVKKPRYIVELNSSSSVNKSDICFYSPNHKEWTKIVVNPPVSTEISSDSDDEVEIKVDLKKLQQRKPNFLIQKGNDGRNMIIPGNSYCTPFQNAHIPRRPYHQTNIYQNMPRVHSNTPNYDQMHINRPPYQNHQQYSHMNANYTQINRNIYPYTQYAGTPRPDNNQRFRLYQPKSYENVNEFYINSRFAYNEKNPYNGYPQN